MKYQLDESLFSDYTLTESLNDGWDEEFEDEPVLGNLENFIYEIRNAVKGAYTGATTYQELADYIEELADELSDFASEVRVHPEDDDNSEEE